MTTIPSAFRDPGADGAVRAPRRWRSAEVQLELATGPLPLRLVRFGDRWLASASTADGPTLGCNVSPYLAASAALEPLGIGLVQVLVALGRHSAALGE